MCFGTAKAQISQLNVSEDAYFVLDDKRSEFHYRYTPQDSIPGHISDSVSLLLGGAIIDADVTTKGDYVILKRVKIVQNGNALTPGVQLTIKMENFFYKANGKQAKNLHKKKHIRRWADTFIDMIEQY